MTRTNDAPVAARVTVEPPLHDGQRLTQPEFHRRYRETPEDFKAELIGGIVYVASRVRRPHGVHHSALNMVVGTYTFSTPGVQACNKGTILLGPLSEPQPDVDLRIAAECGGRTVETADQYLQGPPELIAEVADSSRALDLGARRLDYESAGVGEYVVLDLKQRQLHWFDFDHDDVITPYRGVSRSRIFPGLWLHSRAHFDLDGPTLLATLQEGVASRAHAAFVRRLERTRRKNT